jgi:pimeloyl-ACP methyl ester carboxylesterase
MLARLQQLLVLVWLVALTAAAVVPLRAGHPGWAVVAVTLVLSGHALWLGLTFALMRWRNRSDPAPAASRAQCWRAWWGEVCAAPRVFGWRQPFRSKAEPDFVPPDVHGRPGVVLVHGFVCNRGLWTPWLTAFRQAGVPFVAVNLEPVFGSIDDYVSIIEAAVSRIEAATGEKPVIVGHSMGGLAIRAWLDARGADARVRAIVTLGSPHLGTWLANLGHIGDNARQMRPGGDWLQALARREPASRREMFLCVYGHCDNIVFPASSALLAGARQQHVSACAHIDLVHRAEAMAPVWQALGQAAPTVTA